MYTKSMKQHHAINYIEFPAGNHLAVWSETEGGV